MVPIDYPDVRTEAGRRLLTELANIAERFNMERNANKVRQWLEGTTAEKTKERKTASRRRARS